MTDQLVFVDESLRPGRYLLGCVTVPAAEAGELRRSVHALLLPGERRLHLQRESKRRRRQILDALNGLALDATVFVARHRVGRVSEQARAACMERLVSNAQATGLGTQLYIECREGADQRDREIIIATRSRSPLLDFQHLGPHADPLLWLPDCLAWGIGAGGEWSQRIAPSVTVEDVG